MKYFVISVDTEADWYGFRENQIESIIGIHFLQEICAKYGFTPTYLVTYEIANKDKSIRLLKEYLDKGSCEVGHHLHIWSTPPFAKPNKFGVDEGWIEGIQSELSDKRFSDKMSALHRIIETNFGITPRSHRAGRWAIDTRTLEWLAKNNYLADTSMRPYSSGKRIRGVFKTMPCDTSSSPNIPYFPDYTDFNQPRKKRGNSNLLEIPNTGIKGDLRGMFNFRGCSIIRKLLYKFGYKGVGSMSFRPSDIRIPPKIFEHISHNLFRAELPVVNLMLHSNELFLGTSPYSKTEALLHQLKTKLEIALKIAKQYGYQKATLSEIAKVYREKDHEII